MSDERAFAMNKQVWIDQFNAVVDTLLQHPAEPWQFWTLAVSGFLMIAWVFSRVGERLDVANIDGFAGFIAAAVGTAAMLAAMTAACLYIAPALRIQPNTVFLLIVGVLGSFIVVVPAIKFWTQAKYFNTTAAWFVALISGVFIIMAFSYGFGSFAAGKDKVQSIEQRRALNEALGGK